MPEKRTIARARKDKRRGKAPTTQAGAFIREEMEHIRAGKHGARSTKQAIAIGLSKARRAGVKLPPPRPGQTTPKTRASAERAYAQGQAHARAQPSPRRAQASLGALKREGRSAASRKKLAQQTRAAASQRSAGQRRASARKAARTRAHSRSR
jgi:hypothetical protein